MAELDLTLWRAGVVVGAAASFRWLMDLRAAVAVLITGRLVRGRTLARVLGRPMILAVFR